MNDPRDRDEDTGERLAPRQRRRSLRVPVDDVPRRSFVGADRPSPGANSNGDGLDGGRADGGRLDIRAEPSAEDDFSVDVEPEVIAPLPPPTRTRSQLPPPPPPPRSSLTELRSAEARPTPPRGIPSEPPPGSDVVSTEVDLADDDLVTEPTRVGPPPSMGATEETASQHRSLGASSDPHAVVSSAANVPEVIHPPTGLRVGAGEFRDSLADAGVPPSVMETSEAATVEDPRPTWEEPTKVGKRRVSHPPSDAGALPELPDEAPFRTNEMEAPIDAPGGIHAKAKRQDEPGDGPSTLVSSRASSTSAEAAVDATTRRIDAVVGEVPIDDAISLPVEDVPLPGGVHRRESSTNRPSAESLTTGGREVEPTDASLGPSSQSAASMREFGPASDEPVPSTGHAPIPGSTSPDVEPEVRRHESSAGVDTGDEFDLGTVAASPMDTATPSPSLPTLKDASLRDTSEAAVSIAAERLSTPPTSPPPAVVVQRAVAIIGAPATAPPEPRNTTTDPGGTSAPRPESLGERDSDPGLSLDIDAEAETPGLGEAEILEDAVVAPIEEAVVAPTPPRPAPAPASNARPPTPPARPPAPPSTQPPTGASLPAVDASSTQRAPAQNAPAQKRKPAWWEELFSDDYLRTVPVPSPKSIARQCDFIESRLGLAPGATVLDVGCGLGLHAVELTRRGLLVVGLDLSLPMLSRAAEEAQDQGLKVNFLHADMREMNFENAFDAVLFWGTSFGYFDDETNRQVLERAYRALKPGGLLLLDVVNRDFVIRGQPNLVWFQGDGCVVMEETSFNFIASRLVVKRKVMLDDGRQRETTYSIRLYSLHELGQILHQRGFRVIEVSGREATPGIFFGADSPKLLILAERRIQAPPAPPRRSEDGSRSSDGTKSGEGPSMVPPAEGGASS